MLQNIKDILVGLTEAGDSDSDEASSALAYGMSLAREANAHLTVQAAALKILVPYTFVSRFAASLVAAENRRLRNLATAAAEIARGDAAAAGVACMTEVPQLAYPELIQSFAAQARIHDLTVLDAAPVALAVDRGVIEGVLTGQWTAAARRSSWSGSLFRRADPRRVGRQWQGGTGDE